MPGLLNEWNPIQAAFAAVRRQTAVPIKARKILATTLPPYIAVLPVSQLRTPNRLNCHKLSMVPAYRWRFDATTSCRPNLSAIALDVCRAISSSLSDDECLRSLAGAREVRRFRTIGRGRASLSERLAVAIGIIRNFPARARARLHVVGRHSFRA